ncbi:MAG: hypothetical protein AMXMBFR13_27350 [Phycisphaerae bacterium]
MALHLTIFPVLGAAPVSTEESEAWLRHAVPLPRQVELREKAIIPVERVAVALPQNADPLTTQAGKELRAKLGSASPSGVDEGRFTISLELGGPEAQDLKGLKNSDQAYRIVPTDGNSGLRLTGLSPRGLYYAAKTLSQLILPASEPGSVQIPLARIRDWPELADRGLWGSDSYDHVGWLSDRKMNIIEQISDISVDEQGRGRGKLKKGHDPMLAGPLHALKPVPVILHLEQVSQKGVYQAYPQLKAEGGQEGSLCYSKPEIVDVLADWIAALGSLPGVTEVDVWLAENLHQQGGCQCAECSKEDRNVLEVRAVLAGWKKARERVPHVSIYILTSEETEKSNEDIFKELPPEVKVWYYHSLLTYNTSHTRMLRKYLADYAATGRWIGVCPNLTGFVNFPHPFTGAAFIHHRMNEFADKGMSGLIGYATPRVLYSPFNVEAAAEWTWNPKGRTPREFALSYAVRRGMKDPAKFAAWSEAIGPVAWDVYGSDWPSGEQRSNPAPVAIRLAKGELGPLGSDLWGVYRSPWGDIKNVSQLEKDVAMADVALDLARQMGIVEYEQESLVVQGYIRSLKALWELRGRVTTQGVPRDQRDVARGFFRMYIDGMNQAAAALKAWEETLAARPPGARFTDKPIGVIRTSVEQMSTLAVELGLADGS